MSTAAALRTPEEIARRSGSSFLVSFSALEPARRRALTAIYAFCRVADDAADDEDAARDGRARLAFWRDELERAAAGRAQTPVGRALASVIAEFRVDPRHLQAILDGVQMDFERTQIETEDQLLHYCDQVAGAVGLSCLPVFGASGAHAERYAIALGRALQITNIARDLHADACAGRVYVPQDWLRAAGVDAAWLGGAGPAPEYERGGGVDRVVSRLVEAARAFFAQARRELTQTNDPRRLLPAEVMGAVYARVLDRVAAAGGRNVRRGVRARVPAWQKVWIAWRTRRRFS